MVKSGCKKFLKSGILSIAVFSAFLQPLCAKTKKSKTTKADTTEGGQVKVTLNSGEAVKEADGSVKLSVKKPTYFSKIDPEILSGVETGSPDSIRTAMDKIRKGESEYTENEKVLIYIAAEIMKSAWPSEKLTWDTFSVSDDNSYVGAINSANKGIFDSSTGNTDFLSTLLPAILIFKTTANSIDYDLCEQAVKSALEMRSDSILADYMLGLIYEKTQKNDLALNYYKTVYQQIPQNREIILAYSKLLRLTGNYELCSTVLNGLQDEEGDEEVLKQNAYLAFDSKDYDSAEQYVARVLQKNPNDLDFVLLRAKILVEKNDYIHAVSMLDVYARQDSTSLDYLLLRSKVQLDWSKNTNAATENIEKALQIYPDSAEALLLAARISSMTDSPVAGLYADDLAGKVLQNQPENKDALTYALNGLVQRENWSEAYKISSKLVQSKPVSPELIEKHVQICIKMNKKSEAYDFAKKMHDENPDNEAVTQSYVYAFCQTGNRDVVIKYLDSQIASSSVSSRMKSYLYYRRSFLQFGEDAALADLRSSLISNPRNSDSLFRLYEIYYAKADYRKAQYYLRQVVAINPNDSSVKQLNEALTKLMQ